MAKCALMLLVALFLCSGMAYGKDDRWYPFAEDPDLSYYIDKKSVLRTPDNTYLFWVKVVGRKKEFLKKEYRMNDLEYILFNYEISCAKGLYKTRGTIYYDRSGKQLDKQIPTYLDMSDAEPVPPESIMELAQDAVCSGPDTEEGADQPASAP